MKKFLAIFSIIVSFQSTSFANQSSLEQSYIKLKNSYDYLIEKGGQMEKRYVALCNKIGERLHKGKKEIGTMAYHGNEVIEKYSSNVMDYKSKQFLHDVIKLSKKVQETKTSIKLLSEDIVFYNGACNPTEETKKNLVAMNNSLRYYETKMGEFDESLDEIVETAASRQ